MAEPYISTRSGSTQWLMQRVSAMLLVGMAALHFALQHFTTDAVSTGLTVAARLNNPYWQAFYVVFLVLALYHGINGAVGIVRDYNPRRPVRILIEGALWALAAYFAMLGVRNVVSPVPLGTVKESYAVRGFPAGISHGNPPATPVAYDFRAELRELALMEYYLAHHVHRSDDTALAVVFGHDPAVRLDQLPEAEARAAVAASGSAFDRWLLARISAGPARPEDRQRGSMFSHTYEFAVWAAQVRLANARLRNDAATTARLGTGLVPAYRANDLH
jgi:succinate dehydrogenase / fumarate reductase membrane anchor subunit